MTGLGADNRAETAAATAAATDNESFPIKTSGTSSMSRLLPIANYRTMANSCLIVAC